MNVTLSLFAGAGAQFFDNSGVPLTGGKIYTYSAGTTTPAVTYTTVVGNVAHANPIILDSAGRVPNGGEIWLQVGAGYKFIVKTSTDVLLATYDNVPTSAIAPIANDASAIAYEPGYLITAGGFVVGQTYQIASLGNTDFTLIGAAANVVGAFFVATGVGSGSGTAYLSTTVQAKLRQTVSVFDFMTAAQIADVQAGTGLIDCLAAIQAAINSFSKALDTTNASYAGTLWFPPGIYYCSGTLNISRQIILLGATAPDANEPGASRLLFADNVNGIALREYRTSSDGKDAVGTIIQNLAIICKRNAGGTIGSGVYMQTRAQIKNCYINGFREYGVRVDSSAGTNVNCWHIDQLRTVNNTLDGVYCKGGDANAGVGVRIDASNNGRYGIYDSSFLGNTWVACHTAANGDSSYKTDNLNSNCVFLGCYDEGGYTAASFTPSTNVFGGVLSTYTATGAQRIGNNTVSGINTQNGTATFYAGINQNVTDTAWSFTATSADINRVTYTTGRWFWRQAAFGPATYLYIYDSKATVANGYARNLPNGGIGFPSGYYVGDYDVQKYRGVASAAPVSGSWLQGDIVYNSAPTSGGYVGWVCTASGTPGTWKTFGVIS